MTTKYLEIDSTNRNRQLWPLQARFDVEYNRSQIDDDPISNAAPSVVWQGGNVAVAGTVVSSTTTTVVFTAANLPTTLNYDTNAIFTPPGARIRSYTYLGANQAQVTLATAMSSSLAPATPVTITDTTDLTVLRVFVPGATPITPTNFFNGQILYDETLGLYAKIVAYDPILGVITVANAIPGWMPTDSFSIRPAPPDQIGTTGGASTVNSIVGVTVEPGAFIRILPSYPSVAPAGEIRRVVAFDSTTSTATVFPAFTASPALLAFEVLPFSCSNTRQLTYSGTRQIECVNSTIRLLNMILPNELISVGYGGRPTDYPYFYVKLTPRGYSNIDVNSSNNPNATNMLFRVTNEHTTSITPIVPFVKFSGDGAAVRVRFRIDHDLSFQVTLPNGETLAFIPSDTTSPEKPNPLLQISVLFEVIRDHGLGTVSSGAYGSH